MLTDRKIRAIKPEAKPRKHFDQGGLFLLVTPQGSRLWRLKYRVGHGGERREKLLALGAYPAVTLAEARRRQGAAKESLRQGGDPLAERLASRVRASLRPVESVAALAREWHGKQAPRWSRRHATAVIDKLERLVFPTLGELHVNDVTPPLMLACIRKIEARGKHATAHMVRQHMDAIFAYAISTGIGQINAAAHIRGALAPIVRGHQPALLDLDGVRDLLRRIETDPGYPSTKLAFRLLALTACRSGEVRGAAWCEFEHLSGVAPVWRIPAQRMKAGTQHIVPLSPQAVAVVEALQPLTGQTDLLFPNTRSFERPMGRSAFLDVLYRCGFRGRHCAHGFRSSFSTIMAGRHPQDGAAIDAALAHVVGGTRGAYMRNDYLGRRRELMAEWADLLLDGAPPPETLLYGLRR
ncbi:MAG TPA: integrase arm-type DNA-binding domain-containing protein [Hyphomicrobiaceae bacterium]|nr:integrase arm-type DNA-binding domain-containing protein [Hyphomicrobiaceae bacterium]